MRACWRSWHAYFSYPEQYIYISFVSTSKHGSFLVVNNYVPLLECQKHYNHNKSENRSPDIFRKYSILWGFFKTYVKLIDKILHPTKLSPCSNEPCFILWNMIIISSYLPCKTILSKKLKKKTAHHCDAIALIINCTICY